MEKKENVNIVNPIGMPGRPIVPRPPVRPAPVAAPARGPIQLQPIVQPVALVPYNTDNQNIDQYDDEFNGNEEFDDYCTDSRRLNASKLLTFIFGLVAVAVLILGKFLNMAALKPYLTISGTKSGLEIIMGITTVISSTANFMEKLPTILLTAGAALLVILMLISIFSVKRGTGGFCKILAVLMAICLIAFVVLTIIDKSAAYGGYIVGGISLLIAIFTLAGKKRR